MQHACSGSRNCRHYTYAPCQCSFWCHVQCYVAGMTWPSAKQQKETTCKIASSDTRQEQHDWWCLGGACLDSWWSQKPLSAVGCLNQPSQGHCMGPCCCCVNLGSHETAVMAVALHVMSMIACCVKSAAALSVLSVKSDFACEHDLYYIMLCDIIP